MGTVQVVTGNDFKGKTLKKSRMERDGSKTLCRTGGNEPKDRLGLKKNLRESRTGGSVGVTNRKKRSL